MNTQRTVLVFGATGQQGGAVVKALQIKGHHIIGLTRNPDSDKAKALAATGVDIRKGNFHSAADLDELMREVDTVFALTTPFEEGVEKETAQGVATAEAAKRAGVSHFIYSSVGNADQETGIPHFDSKYGVEQRILELGLPHTIVAPVYFMDNLIAPWTIEKMQAGVVNMAMPGGRMLQQIAVQDIAAIVAEIVDRREEFFGKRIDIAGDELTGEQMAVRLSQITGTPFSYEGFSPDFYPPEMEDMALMYKWFDAVGYSADIEGLKATFPNVVLTSFESFAKQQDWSILN